MIKEWKYGYTASDDGVVYSKQGGVLKTHKCGTGKGLCVTIYGDKRISTKNVARIIAETFVPNNNPDVKTVVIHLNGDINDNRAENLMWVSKSVASTTRYNTK